MKNGNGLYLGMKAIAGTMPHIKSEPRIQRTVGAEARRMS